MEVARWTRAGWKDRFLQPAEAVLANGGQDIGCRLLFCSDRVRSQMPTRRHVLTAAIFHILSKLRGETKA